MVALERHSASVESFASRLPFWSPALVMLACSEAGESPSVGGGGSGIGGSAPSSAGSSGASAVGGAGASAVGGSGIGGGGAASVAGTSSGGARAGASGSAGHGGVGGSAAGHAGSGGSSGGTAGHAGSAGNAGASPMCQTVKAEYAAELEKQLGCKPGAASQCTDRVASAPGCECLVFIEPVDPFAIEHLSNVANAWYDDDCSMPVCPAKCSTASAGTCQADSKNPLGGRCVTP